MQHERHECDMSATLETRVQHERDTGDTSEIQVRHECYTNGTSATQVKNSNFEKDTSKNIFSHIYIYYMESERLQEEKKFFSKN